MSLRIIIVMKDGEPDTCAIVNDYEELKILNWLADENDKRPAGERFQIKSMPSDEIDAVLDHIATA